MALQTGYQHFPGMVLALDRHGQILDVSQSWLHQLGYQSHDVLGHGWLEFIAAEQGLADDLLARCLASAETPCQAGPISFAAATGLPVRLTLAATYQPNAAPAHVVVLLTALPDAANDPLQPSVADLRHLIEHIPQIVWVTDAATYQVLYISQAFETVYGRSRQLVYSDPDAFLESVHPEDCDRVQQALDAERQQGIPFNEEYRIIRPDGELRWIRDLSFPVLDPSRRGGNVIGLSEDITDRKQAEEQLRANAQQLRHMLEHRHQVETQIQQQREFLQTVLDTTSNLIFVKDQQGRYLLANRAMAALYGTTPDILQGKQDADFHPFPQENSQFVRENQQVIRTGEPVYIDEQPMSQADGSVLWFQWQKYPLQLPGSHEMSVLGIGTDITQRHRTNQALQQSEAMNWAIQHVLPDLLIQMHRDGTYLNVKASREYVLIRPADAMVGCSVWEILPEATARQRLEYARRALQTGETQLYEFPLAIEQQTRWQEARIVPLMADQVLVVVRDITDRKQAEIGLQQLNAELEVRVQQRTAQLEAANQELESFSYSVSHDLRAPLRHIGGFIDILSEHLQTAEGLDDTAQQYLQIIQKSAAKMEQLIEGLLTLSRVGRRDLQPQAVDLNTLVDRAIALFSAPDPSAHPHPPVFQVADLPTVEGDASLLQQVFSNLIDNAVKFSGQRQPAYIEIGVLPNQVIYIKDNGVGFSRQHADRLFSPFQRLHSSHEFSGMGIGLAVVHRIVKRHRGRLWVESEPDQGTTFFVQLP